MFLKTLRIKTEQQATAAHVFFLFFLIMSWPEFAWLQFLPHPILVLSSGLKPFPDFIYFTGKKWQHNLLAMPANHTTQRKRTWSIQNMTRFNGYGTYPVMSLGEMSMFC